VVDEPDPVDEVEETLEAFRQMSGATEGSSAAESGRDPQDDSYDPEVAQEGDFPFPGQERPPEVAAPEEEVVVEPPQTPTAPAEGTQAPPVAAQPAATAPQPPLPTGTQVPSPEVTFRELASQLDANLGQITDVLATQVYNVSDKDLDDLQSNPKAVYGRMMARVHVNAVSSVMRTLAQQIPVVVHGMMQAVRANDQAEGRFWNQYPQLDRNNPQHRQTVATIARNVRAMNPTMSEGDMVRFTGAQAAVMLGVAGTAAPPRRPGPPSMPGRQVRQVAPSYSAAGTRAQAGPPGIPQRGQWDLMTSLIQMENAGRFDPT